MKTVIIQDYLPLIGWGCALLTEFIIRQMVTDIESADIKRHPCVNSCMFLSSTPVLHGNILWGLTPVLQSWHSKAAAVFKLLSVFPHVRELNQSNYVQGNLACVTCKLHT